MIPKLCNQKLTVGSPFCCVCAQAYRTAERILQDYTKYEALLTLLPSEITQEAELCAVLYRNYQEILQFIQDTDFRYRP